MCTGSSALLYNEAEEVRSVQIYVDADACPVLQQIEDMARMYVVPVTLFCDTHHVLHSDYCELRLVDAGKDAVDIALTNRCCAGDIVVTQDFGLARFVLDKGAYAIHPSGWRYQNLSEDEAAHREEVCKRIRELQQPWKRNKERKRRQFEEAFEDLVIIALEHEVRE